MRDVELHATILRLAPPWKVVAVEVDVKGEQVTVKVQPGPGPFPCPECQTAAPGYDRKPRRWRHLDTCLPEPLLSRQSVRWPPVRRSTTTFRDGPNVRRRAVGSFDRWYGHVVWLAIVHDNPGLTDR